MRLVLASNNAKKLTELQALFAGLQLQLVSQTSLGISEAEEPHHSFVENALAKARHAAKASGGPALADDSGLCVPALGGAPGVRSSHFAELLLADDSNPDAKGSRAGDLKPASPSPREALRARQDTANNHKLLSELSNATDRRAWFFCILVAVRHAQDPEPLIATGRWHGRLLHEAQGEGGFGYDPLLWIDEQACTVAQMPVELKNRCSHRALAAAQLREQLQQVWRV